jgi:hypothetical protein
MPSAFAVLRLMTNSELDRLMHWQIGGLSTLENPTRINAYLAAAVCNVGPVAHEAARDGIIAKLTLRWQLEGIEEWISGDKQRRNMSLDKRGKCWFQFPLASRNGNFDAPIKGASGFACLSQLFFGSWRV